MADHGPDTGAGTGTEPNPPSAWPRQLPPGSTQPISHRAPPRVPDHELLRSIGSGAYGEVWLARNVLGAYRAVKVVYRASFDSERPYRREFDGIQRVEPISRAHPGHVPILQAGRNDPEGYFYYVMELADDANLDIPGAAWDPVVNRLQDVRAGSIDAYVPRTLKEDLKRRNHLEFDECLRLALALAAGLDFLHKHGLVHRDIKPSNIIYVDGAPKFTDIGLVTIADATCSLVGTEGYLPPEGPGSTQADLFSLGKVLYEAATGMDRRYYPELPDDWPPLEDADRWLEINAIVLKACKRDPHQRYQSAAQLHADLLLLQSGKSVRRTHLLEQRLASFYQIAAILTVVTAVASGAYLWASFQMRQAEENLHRAELSEAGMREQLRESLLYQARALRLSRLPGQRIDALDALGRAGAIRTGPDLLSEVIRCIGLTDVRSLRQWTTTGAGHSDFTPDLRLGLVASSDPHGAITVRTISDDAVISELPGPNLPCLLALFSPDGSYLAAKYHLLDQEPLNRTTIWNLASNSVQIQIPNPIASRAIGFDPMNIHVAVGSWEREITVYDLLTGHPVLQFPVDFVPYALSYSPDGTRLAIAGSDGTVQIHEAMEGRLLSSFAHPASARGLDWHPDGVRLAVPCDDWLVHLWDVEAERRVALFAGHKAQVVTAQFSHDGKLLATISWDKTMALWNVERVQALLSYPVSGGTRFVGFNSDDTQLVRFGDGLKAEVLELIRPVPIYQTTGLQNWPLHSADISSNGRLIAYATGRGVRIEALDAAFPGQSWPVPAAASVRFLPDGRLVTVGETGLFISAWDGDPPHLGSPAVFWNHRLTASMDALAVATRTNRAIIRTDLNTALLLNLETTPVPVSRFSHPQITSVAINATGHLVATTGSPGGNVTIWDANTGLVRQQWTDVGPARVVFDPVNDRLILASPTGCRIIDNHSWDILHQVPPPTSTPTTTPPYLAVSNDGELLAVGWTSDQITLVQLPQGRVLMTLEALGQSPLCFSPDTSALYVKGQYSGIYRWQLQTLREELAYIGLDW
jgi:WD40 repeat protein